MSDDRFARIERMVGAEGLRRLREAHVAVAGLGAVGSYAAEALARAGVGRLRLVDCDVIRPSNFNRQLYALESTLGLPKVEAARRRILEIQPACAVEPLELFVRAETLDRVLAGPPDLLIDAIDSVNPKVELIAETLRRGIQLISSMGAALRTDPSKVRVGPFAEARSCPFARQVRKKLRQMGADMGFTCVHSTEPTSGLPEAAIGPAGPESEAPFERGRPRHVLGSLPTLTGIFGLTAANQALQMILGDLFPGKV